MTLSGSSTTVVFDAAQTILDCVVTGLETECDVPPARACVIVGRPVLDDCCDGQLTVGVTRISSSASFPVEFSPIGGSAPCGAPILLLYMDVSLFRCAPTLDDDGTPPSCEILSLSAVQIYYESRVVWRAVECCLYNLALTGVDGVIMGQDVIDPEGGCVGTVMHIIVGILDPCGCG